VKIYTVGFLYDNRFLVQRIWLPDGSVFWPSAWSKSLQLVYEIFWSQLHPKTQVIIRK